MGESQMTKTKNQKANAKAQKRAGSKNPGKSSGKPQNQGRVQTVYKSLSLSISPHAFNFLRSSLFASSGPVRVPDVCQVTTSVFSATSDFSLTPNSNGCLGFQIGINGVPRFCQEDTTSTTNALVYQAFANIPAAASIFNSFSAVRPTSAEVHGYSTTATLSDQGQIMGFTIACNSIAALETVPTSSNLIASMRDNWTFPSKEGIFIRYKPTDNTSYVFTPTAGSNLGFTRGILGVHAEGLATTAVFRFKLVVNYECIPNSDVISYQGVEQSKYDGPGFDIVRGIMGTVPSFSDYAHVEKYLSQGLQMANNVNKAVQFTRQLVSAYGATVRN